MWTVRHLALGACLLLAACGSNADAATPPPPAVKAAASAGGACHLLDYARVKELVGLEFSAAGSAKKDKTNTCVLRSGGGAQPELSLSVTPSSADVAVFRDTVLPKGAKAVTGLGRVGYQKGLEVGWLAGNSRLLLLKIVLPKGTDQAGVEAKLVDLAKEIDKSSL